MFGGKETLETESRPTKGNEVGPLHSQSTRSPCLHNLHFAHSNCGSGALVFATWQDKLKDMLTLVKAGKTCRTNRAHALGQATLFPCFLVGRWNIVQISQTWDWKGWINMYTYTSLQRRGFLQPNQLRAE